MIKKLDDYLALPYTIELTNYPDEGWFVRVKELPGCMSQGKTAEEAIEMILDAMQLWLESSLEKGLPIPEPKLEDEFSGKFVVRVPRSLHRRLVEEAEQDGVSLNQFINVALAGVLAGRVSSLDNSAQLLGYQSLQIADHERLPKEKYEKRIRKAK
jgi:antitoxin HicB